ncbi:MAG: hypothetical protein ACF8R7_13895 [Phycisphaerales bacterium JB039]
MALEFWNWLSTRSPGETVALGLGLALLLEALTLALRFGLGMRSATHTRWIGRRTRGLRVHHGYPGLAAAPLGAGLGLGLGPSALGTGLVIVGIGLLVSDLLHHFVVLRLATGAHEFDLRYPD